MSTMKHMGHAEWLENWSGTKRFGKVLKSLLDFSGTERPMTTILSTELQLINY